MKPISKPKSQTLPMVGWSLELVLDPGQAFFRLAQVLESGALEKEFGAL